MSTRVSEVDALDSPRRRGILYAIALSLLVHALAFVAFHDDRTLVETENVAQNSISVSLLKPQIKSVQAVSEPMRSPSRPLELPEPDGSSPEEAINPALPVPPTSTSLDTSVADLVAPPESEQRRFFSNNGAVVLQPSLLAQLDVAQQMLEGPADGYIPEMESGFRGGTWKDQLRFGDTCFRVDRGDPLEPFSTEKWFRVACKL